MPSERGTAPAGYTASRPHLRATNHLRASEFLRRRDTCRPIGRIDRFPGIPQPANGNKLGTRGWVRARAWSVEKKKNLDPRAKRSIYARPGLPRALSITSSEMG